MLEFLKKIGLPGIIAALVSALITMIPILFQIDDRYAKAEEIKERNEILSKQILDLSKELSVLAGTQQVIVSIMSKSEIVEQPKVLLKSAPPPNTSEPKVETSEPEPKFSRKPAEFSSSSQLDEVARQLKRSQQNIEQIQSY